MAKKGFSRPKRNIKRVNYAEEDIPEDCYIYCDRCKREYEGDCPVHGPLLIIEDNEVPKDKKNLMRAMQTAPSDYLCIRESSIPNAGLGVWTIQRIPIGVRFGPFEGKKILISNNDEYCWPIRKDGRITHYLDGKYKGSSNWMRYVNCSRNNVEENLAGFQFMGKIYYRTIKDVDPHTELLLWYGAEYGKRLGIDPKTYNTPIDKKLLPEKQVTIATNSVNCLDTPYMFGLFFINIIHKIL